MAGVEIQIPTSTTSAESVREALRAVLEDPTYRERAETIQSRYVAHDGPVEAARLLERLAVNGGPVVRYTVLDERLRLMDSIVGRCVLDRDFGASVLCDPDRALSAYNLSEDELDDFRALSRQGSSCLDRWAQLGALFAA